MSSSNYWGHNLKVFLSWSGAKTKSHAVARALDEWLPTVLNAVEPWVSSRGLVAGLQWNQQLDKELDDTNFGIIVVTPWNQHSQWLNFEAGALSKRVGGLESRVAPLLVDFPNVAKLTGPLSGYQVVLPTRDGIHALIVSLNQALGDESRKFEALERAFEVCWPALESKLQQINQDLPSEEDPATAPSPEPTAADDTDMLSEILTAVRGLARSDARLTDEIRKSASATIDGNSLTEVSRHGSDLTGQSRSSTVRSGTSMRIAVEQMLDQMDAFLQVVQDDEEVMSMYKRGRRYIEKRAPLAILHNWMDDAQELLIAKGLTPKSSSRSNG